MNSTLLEIIKSREDISEYLFHFTKGANAAEVLEKILNDNAIIDVGNGGVICFTEAPLVSLPGMFKIFDRYVNPMYAPYGIAIKKNFLFAKGARHVIYGPSEDRQHLGSQLEWRFEEYHPERKDFTWLREWRLKENQFELDPENCFIITKSKEELPYYMFDQNSISNIEFDGCVADGQFWGEATATISRRFKGISIEDLYEFNSMSKAEIDKALSLQNLDDTDQLSLGGFLA